MHVSKDHTGSDHVVPCGHKYPSGEGRASTPQQPAPPLPVFTKALTGIVGERGRSHQLRTANTGFGPSLSCERQDHTPLLQPKEKPRQKPGSGGAGLYNSGMLDGLFLTLSLIHHAGAKGSSVGVKQVKAVCSAHADP